MKFKKKLFLHLRVGLRYRKILKGEGEIKFLGGNSHAERTKWMPLPYHFSGKFS